MDMTTRGRSGPVASLAEWLAIAVAGRLSVGRLDLGLPTGRRSVIAGRKAGLAAELEIRDWRTLSRLLAGGGVGFAEAYVDGCWDTADLDDLLLLLALNQEALGTSRRRHPWRHVARLVDRLRRDGSRDSARRDIAYHYDLGNEFYGHWLDEAMTYSAGIFERPDDGLAAAQANKFRRIAAIADIRTPHEVLEIGCGRGGFACWLAREIGCRVTAITISDAQFAFASARVQQEGLGDRVEIRRQDYRDVAGQFDRVASIEMFEAVGERDWPVFFGALRQRLKPDGRAALQIITIADDAFERYRRGVDFIQKYIFPGGMLPSMAALRREVGQAGLRWSRDDAFGLHYARTLAVWRQRFEAAWPQIGRLGFDERFRRLWRYYLVYCETGFRVGRIDVRQIALQPS